MHEFLFLVLKKPQATDTYKPNWRFKTFFIQIFIYELMNIWARDLFLKSLSLILLLSLSKAWFLYLVVMFGPRFGSDVYLFLYLVLLSSVLKTPWFPTSNGKTRTSLQTCRSCFRMKSSSHNLPRPGSSPSSWSTNETKDKSNTRPRVPVYSHKSTPWIVILYNLAGIILEPIVTFEWGAFKMCHRGTHCGAVCAGSN